MFFYVFLLGGVIPHLLKGLSRESIGIKRMLKENQ